MNMDDAAAGAPLQKEKKPSFMKRHKNACIISGCLLISIGGGFGGATLAYQLSKYLPVVAIGDRRSDLELATVDMNNFTAGQLIGKHLTDWDINMLPIFLQRSTISTPHVCAAIRVWRMPARQQMPSFPSSPKRLLLTTSFRTLK